MMDRSKCRTWWNSARCNHETCLWLLTTASALAALRHVVLIEKQVVQLVISHAVVC
jgi:hypothetical protein